MAETFLSEDDLSGFFKARVIKNIDPSGDGQIAVFIPDLMPNVANSDSEDQGTASVKPASEIFEGSEEFAGNIKTSVSNGNFIWCRPAGNLVEINTTGDASNAVSGNYKVPRNGTWVTVFFDNHDPNRPYYFPFSMTKFGEVIAGTLLGKSSLSTNSKTNWTTPEARVLIEVLMEYHNKNVIYIDNNENANSFVIQWANGHELVIHHADESGIRLKTEQGHTLHLDENSTEIRINTHSDNVSIVYRDSDGAIDIKQSGPFTHKADSIKLNIAGNVDVTAGGNVTVKGSLVQIN